jgi:hypothetical protein
MSAEDDKLAVEARARVLIDQELVQAGWWVEKRKDLNIFAGRSIAVLLWRLAACRSATTGSNGCRRREYEGLR